MKVVKDMLEAIKMATAIIFTIFICSWLPLGIFLAWNYNWVWILPALASALFILRLIS